MKYIINESRLEELIVDYLNKMYDVNDIHWTNPIGGEGYDDGEDDGWNEDPNRLYFYTGDFSDGDRIFNWYDKDYWNVERSDNARNFYQKSPVLDFENENDLETLNGYFGDKWVPIFKKWFEDNFRIPVKSIFNVDV